MSAIDVRRKQAANYAVVGNGTYFCALADSGAAKVALVDAIATQWESDHSPRSFKEVRGWIDEIVVSSETKFYISGTDEASTVGLSIAADTPYSLKYIAEPVQGLAYETTGADTLNVMVNFNLQVRKQN